MNIRLIVLVLIGMGTWVVNQALANLIVNGDFQAGYTGFSSDYIPGQIGAVENSYSIVNDPLGPAPTQNPYAVSYGGIHYYDHTLGTSAGLMMAVNGAGDSSKLVWGQTVSGLTVGQKYEFSVWLSSWDNASPALLDVQINSIPLASFNAPATSGVWVNHSFLWTPDSTSAAFSAIYDNNTVAQGNDFALDDIKLTAVPESTTMFAGIGALGLLLFGAGVHSKRSVLHIGK
jgi:hypothetical protein